jgi:hypothetical protein
VRGPAGGTSTYRALDLASTAGQLLQMRTTTLQGRAGALLLLLQPCRARAAAATTATRALSATTTASSGSSGGGGGGGSLVAVQQQRRRQHGLQASQLAPLRRTFFYQALDKASHKLKSKLDASLLNELDSKKLVGTDCFGNQYFEKPPPPDSYHRHIRSVRPPGEWPLNLPAFHALALTTAMLGSARSRRLVDGSGLRHEQPSLRVAPVALRNPQRAADRRRVTEGRAGC